MIISSATPPACAITVAELQRRPVLREPAHVRSEDPPPGAAKRATKEPGDDVSDLESENGAKRNGGLHEKIRIASSRLEDRSSLALFNSHQATGYQVTVSSPSRTPILRWIRTERRSETERLLSVGR